MEKMIETPQPGQIVRVRMRQYLVEDVVKPPHFGDATIVRMACLDDDAQGQPLEVLWENEVDPEILSGESWQHLAAKGFDPPRLFSAYLHTMRWNCVTATNPRLFQAPFRAGIQIHAYQLEPLRKALVLPRVNLFIADDVGLGKTIEAGLIIREMLLRKRIRDIVVICPPSVLLQWKDELETRFGLTFEVIDKAFMARVRQERGFSVNPWITHTRFLVSQRLLIDEAYAGPLRDWLGDFLPGSVMVLDEAHNAAPSSGARYAIDSKLTRAIRDIAPRFEHRLFLSATPHNGHSNSFSALLEILDPQRFCRGVPVRSKNRLQEVMVRRLKEDLREVAGGFPKRTPVQVDIDGLPEDAPELILSKLLDEYRKLRAERLKGETKRKQAAAGLLISGLQQRLLSSVEAFARTLRVHRRTVQRQWEESQAGKPVQESRALHLDLVGDGINSDDDRATLPEEELQAEEEAQIEAASRATMGTLASEAARKLFAREQFLLEEMARIADTARGAPDARVRWLVDWIRAHMCPGLPPLGMPHPAAQPSPWNDVRIVVFTEYDDTKRYLVQQLNAAIEGTEHAAGRIEVYHGPTPPAKREDIKRAFNEHPRKNPLRILIATDAAREGINLQCHCWNLFHFDLPWNPSRMEQRNGRIDRKLQPRLEVFCHYFVYRQRPEDRILQVLIKKTDTIKKELGSLAPVVEGRLAQSLRMGIRHDEIVQLEREIEAADLDTQTRQTVEEELEEARERQQALLKQVDQLRNRLEESQRWIGLSKDHFRSAISCSLELMGADPLKGVNGGAQDGLPEAFAFPALDQRSGADPTWADTMDTLRAPRQKDQPPWEWRRKSPIRPVVFDAPEIITDDVVHLHLEHRVVRRLLGRFAAQGFVHHDLSRACFSHSTDAIPRVVLLGRLCLYGPGAARLHEELIPIAARWIAPATRKKPLVPYGEKAETATMNLLEEALLKPGKAAAETVLRQLKDAAPRDIAELLPHLEQRGGEYAEEVRQKLAQRGGQEADDMRDILERQREQIQKTKAKYEDPQMFLDFDTDEQRQLQSNQRYWEKRLAAIEHELRAEPARIRALYEVKAQRIEPVGLVYLWPLTG